MSYSSGPSRPWLPFAVAAGVLALIGAIIAISIATRPSDLERLNSDVASLNETLAEAQQQIDLYGGAEADAQNWRTTFADESDDDPTVMGIVDGHLSQAEVYITTARDNLAKAGTPQQEFTSYSKETHDAVKAAKAQAREAAKNAQAGIEELQEIPDLANDVLSEYVRTFIWFEMGDYWPSEEGYDHYDACYYGEVVTTINTDGTLKETIVDDSVDIGMFDNENEKKWRIFTVEDYQRFVDQGIVAPMDDKDPNRTEVGRYLCGNKPQDGQYGALGEPEVTLVKERGSLTLSQEDGETFVGNYDYGTWCALGADGTYQMIPEGQTLPENVEWCWYMPEKDGDPRYYYHGYYNNGLWTYTRGPRRCFDCDAQTWTGGTRVPSSQMAQVTGMDSPDVRSAASDGGPGTGK